MLLVVEAPGTAMIPWPVEICVSVNSEAAINLRPLDKLENTESNLKMHRRVHAVWTHTPADASFSLTGKGQFMVR